MYSEQGLEERKRRRIVRIVVALVLVAAFAIGGFALYRGVGADLEAQRRVALKNAVTNAAVQCFALEGSYPDSLAYLEVNYGLQVNHDEYIVTYTAYASNVLPEVEVLGR